jgi:hypothetical protein
VTRQTEDSPVQRRVSREDLSNRGSEGFGEATFPPTPFSGFAQGSGVQGGGRPKAPQS